MLKSVFTTITLMLCFVGITYGQSEVFWEPSFSYTWKAGNRFSFNTGLAALPTIYDDESSFSDLQRFDISFFSTYKLFGDKSISAGYKFRLAEPFFTEEYGYEHRTAIQFTLISYVSDRRIGHRIRAEQRFRRNSFFNRFRYRTSYDIPLTGAQLDPGEKYLITSNELLYSVNSSTAILDDRIYLGLGWYFTNKRKLETGMQLRLNNLTGNVKGVIHLVTAYYLNR